MHFWVVGVLAIPLDTSILRSNSACYRYDDEGVDDVVESFLWKINKLDERNKMKKYVWNLFTLFTWDMWNSQPVVVIGKIVVKPFLFCACYIYSRYECNLILRVILRISEGRCGYERANLYTFLLTISSSFLFQFMHGLNVFINCHYVFQYWERSKITHESTKDCLGSSQIQKWD